MKELRKSQGLNQSNNIEFSMHALDTVNVHSMLLDVLADEGSSSATAA
jgi:hypothetical protein